MSKEKHLKLEQASARNEAREVVYFVIEARNTVRWQVGEMLTAEQVQGLPAAVSYTVVGPKQ